MNVPCREALTGSAHQVKGRERRGPRHQETTMQDPSPVAHRLQKEGKVMDPQEITEEPQDRTGSWVRWQPQELAGGRS